MGNLRAYTASLDTAIAVPGDAEEAADLELSVFRKFRKSHDRRRNSVITLTHINFECSVSCTFKVSQLMSVQVCSIPVLTRQCLIQTDMG